MGYRLRSAGFRVWGLGALSRTSTLTGRPLLRRSPRRWVWLLYGPKSKLLNGCYISGDYQWGY